jgi:hypothetical protein
MTYNPVMREVGEIGHLFEKNNEKSDFFRNTTSLSGADNHNAHLVVAYIYRDYLSNKGSLLRLLLKLLPGFGYFGLVPAGPFSERHHNIQQAFAQRCKLILYTRRDFRV